MNQFARLISRLVIAVIAAFFGQLALAQGSAYAVERVTLRSGGGQGIAIWAGTSRSPISPAPIALPFQATLGPPWAVEVAPLGAWLSALPSDPAARWLSTSSSRGPASFVLTHPFTLSSCRFDFARLVFRFAVDDQLGDSINPGLFLNGVPLANTNGAGFQSEGMLTVTGIEHLLIPGENRLHVYCRDVAAQASGVVYSAELSYVPCYKEEVVRLRSGNGTANGPDAQVRALAAGLSALTVNEFQAAAAASPAHIANFGGHLPCTGLAADPAAQFVQVPQHGVAAALFAHPLPYSCGSVGGHLRLDYSVYSWLGSAGGNGPNVGIYLNDHALTGSVGGAAAGSCDQVFEAEIPGGVLSANGPNWLYVYVEDHQATHTVWPPLVCYSAELRLRGCVPAEQVVLESGTGSRVWVGSSMQPLRNVPFGAADFARPTQAASVVIPRPNWLQSLPQSNAQWLGSGQSSALFAQDFQISTCAGGIGRATLTVRCAGDDRLGDQGVAGGNPCGFYLNGKPVAASWATAGYGAETVLIREVGDLLVSGQNTLYVYVRDVAGFAAGAIWHATIDIPACDRPSGAVGCFGVAVTPVATPWRLGSVGQVALGGLDSGASLAMLALGERTFPGLDLGAVGAPGCTFHISPLVTVLGVPQAGAFNYGLALPNDTGLAGLELAAQGLYFDPNWNAAGVVATPTLTLPIEQ